MGHVLLFEHKNGLNTFSSLDIRKMENMRDFHFSHTPHLRQK